VPESEINILQKGGNTKTNQFKADIKKFSGDGRFYDGLKPGDFEAALIPGINAWVMDSGGTPWLESQA